MCARSEPHRKPWSLKWVAVAILLCIVPYTWLTLKYRKPGKSFQPYEDTKERANVVRLLDAGFQRVAIAAERPAESTGVIDSAAITDAAGGLPLGLGDTLVDTPLLPQTYSRVAAPGDIAALLPYRLEVTCILPDHKEQLGGAEVYIRSQAVVIVPRFERIEGELLARSKESPVVLTLPAGALKPGRYHVTLAATQQSKQWTLEVR